MSAISAIADRFAEMPRALRWLAIAVVLIIGFLLWSETISVAALRMERDAERMERDVALVRDAGRWQLKRYGDTVISFGEVEPPTPEDVTRAALTDAVNQVLGSHGIKGPFKLNAAGQKLNRNDSRRLVANTSDRATRLTGTVGFECAHDQAIDVIADFEARPEIELISSVRITKGEGRRKTVKVDLTLEAWMITSDGRRN